MVVKLTYINVMSSQAFQISVMNNNRLAILKLGSCIVKSNKKAWERSFFNIIRIVQLLKDGRKCR